MNGMKRRPKKRSKRAIKAGDEVLIRYGNRDVRALVLEDRGLIGKDARRHFLVQVHLAFVTPDKVVELPEEHLRLAPRRAKRLRIQIADASTAER